MPKKQAGVWCSGARTHTDTSQFGYLVPKRFAIPVLENPQGRYFHEGQNARRPESSPIFVVDAVIFSSLYFNFFEELKNGSFINGTEAISIIELCVCIILGAEPRQKGGSRIF